MEPKQERAAQEAAGSVWLTDELIRDECLSFFFAGKLLSYIYKEVVSHC